MAPRGVRGSADERREDVLMAAMAEFAKGGLTGTSTEAIATRAGISQPYLFRLYPTKRALFLAAIQRTFAEVTRVFGEAAEGLTGLDAKHAMGEAYGTLLREDRTFLGMQLQAYAGCFGDDEVRALTRREFARLWEHIVTVGGMSEELAQAFVAHGMLCNLTAAFGIPTDGIPTDGIPTDGIPTDGSVAGTGEVDTQHDSLARRMTAPPLVMGQLMLDSVPS